MERAVLGQVVQERRQLHQDQAAVGADAHKGVVVPVQHGVGDLGAAVRDGEGVVYGAHGGGELTGVAGGDVDAAQSAVTLQLEAVSGLAVVEEAGGDHAGPGRREAVREQGVGADAHPKLVVRHADAEPAARRVPDEAEAKRAAAALRVVEVLVDREVGPGVDAVGGPVFPVVAVPQERLAGKEVVEAVPAPVRALLGRERGVVVPVPARDHHDGPVGGAVLGLVAHDGRGEVPGDELVVVEQGRNEQGASVPFLGVSGFARRGFVPRGGGGVLGLVGELEGDRPAVRPQDVARLRGLRAVRRRRRRGVANVRGVRVCCRVAAGGAAKKLRAAARVGGLVEVARTVQFEHADELQAPEVDHVDLAASHQRDEPVVWQHAHALYGKRWALHLVQAAAVRQRPDGHAVVLVQGHQHFLGVFHSGVASDGVVPAALEGVRRAEAAGEGDLLDGECDRVVAGDEHEVGLECDIARSFVELFEAVQRHWVARWRLSLAAHLPQDNRALPGSCRQVAPVPA
ncbi:uncharacterized protein BcabD6B2_40340 [Babesia caballi]|uniref:Uncharacterized protein n=1 Tax=Babesia caballi TaxID=5871 RepID=A0AAV4LX19_BABCB|nr:hypothetical protein BcabD6B2_40340 [Babesia caballi]